MRIAARRANQPHARSNLEAEGCRLRRGAIHLKQRTAISRYATAAVDEGDRSPAHAEVGFGYRALCRQQFVTKRP